MMRSGTVFIPLLFLLLLPLSGQAQTWKWAQSLGDANSNTAVTGIRPYAGTGVLVCGSYASAKLSLGGNMLNNAGQDDGYVAIADAGGQYAWAAGFGGSGRDVVVDAAAAPDGSFAVAGNFNSLFMVIGSATLFNSGETDGFVAKYNPDKTLAWAQKIGTADIDEVSGLAVDADGNVYISGQVRDKFTQSTLHTFVRKLNAAGALVWEQKGTTQGNSLQTTALAIDAGQNVYLGGGLLYGTATFGGITLKSDTSYAAFMVKYSPSGALLDTWLNPALDKINGLQARGNHLYACAEKVKGGLGWGWPLFDSKTHVLQLDAEFNTVWHKTAGGETPFQSLDIAKNLSLDDDGNVYVTGYFFSDTLHFAGQALPNPFNIHYYYPQIFVFKYSPAGDELWAKSLGGIHADEGTGILAFGDDKFWLGGNFESDPVAFGAFELRNTGKLDSMYVHLRPARYVRKTMGFLAMFDKEASGANPEPAFGGVTLFPNPASDYITVRLKSPTNSPLIFQLIAPDGRVLRQSTYPDGTAGIREELTVLAPGMYMVILRTDKGVFSGKVLKW
ncbi:MAG: T9SS type A sorting domain-containing protein [Thermoanaerobaculia bacterium]|nr:T9SS type A sorting domain-containing protein [Thermoanaerobaculia bacterium]